jgi:hypothetical protein
MIWESELLMQYPLIDLLMIETIVGWNAQDELIEECSQAVIVKGECVSSSK